jgi:hypothetical protein
VIIAVSTASAFCGASSRVSQSTVPVYYGSRTILPLAPGSITR